MVENNGRRDRTVKESNRTAHISQIRKVLDETFTCAGTNIPRE